MFTASGDGDANDLASAPRAFALAAHFTRVFHIGEHGTNPFTANTGTRTFDILQPEVARLIADGINHQSRLCSARGLDLAGAFLKFTTGAVDDGEKMVTTDADTQAMHARRAYELVRKLLSLL